MNEQSIKFIDALMSDKVCLAPVDSIPGLVFNPHSVKARAKLEEIKNRTSDKGYISLVPSVTHARKYWKDLDPKWKEYLARNWVWPGPLSVVHEASDKAPLSVCHEGTIGLRVPLLKTSWLQEVLEVIDFPLPSTSVNIAGYDCMLDWTQAVFWCMGNKDIYVPLLKAAPTFIQQPSTIISIRKNEWKLEREGAFLKDDLPEA